MAQGEVTQSRPKKPDPAPIGVSLSFKNAGLGGDWTIQSQSQDGKTITISQVVGDSIITQTMDASKLDAVKNDPGNRTALRTTGRKMAPVVGKSFSNFSDGSGQFEINGFDGARRRYHVSGMIDGVQVDRWVEEGVARELNRNALASVSLHKLGLIDEPKKGLLTQKEKAKPKKEKGSAIATEVNKETINPVAQKKETDDEDSGESVREARQELREQKKTQIEELKQRGQSRRTTGDLPRSTDGSTGVAGAATIGAVSASIVGSTDVLLQRAGVTLQNLQTRGVQIQTQKNALQTEREGLTKQLIQLDQRTIRAERAGDTQGVKRIHSQSERVRTQRDQIGKSELGLQIAESTNRSQQQLIQRVLEHPTPELLQTLSQTIELDETPIESPGQTIVNESGMETPTAPVRNIAVGFRVREKMISVPTNGLLRRPSSPTQPVKPILQMAELGSSQQRDRQRQNQPDVEREPVIKSAAPDLTASYATKTENPEKQKFRRENVEAIQRAHNLTSSTDAEGGSGIEAAEPSVMISPEYQDKINRSSNAFLAPDYEAELYDEDEEENEEEATGDESLPPARLPPPAVEPVMGKTGGRLFNTVNGSLSWDIIDGMILVVTRTVQLPFVRRMLPSGFKLAVEKTIPESSVPGQALTLSMYIGIILAVVLMMTVPLMLFVGPMAYVIGLFS